MAISIGGTVVIDDSRNIVNVNDIRVGLVTITGSTGNIETPGTITGGGFGVAGTGFSVSPGIGATDVDPQTIGSIILSFPTSVIRGTGTIKISSGSTDGTTIRSYNAATAPEITVLNNTWVISVASTSFGSRSAAPVLPGFSTVFLVVPSTAIIGFVGLNTTGASSYSFITQKIGNPGEEVEGGYLICREGGTAFIVSPYSTEVSRTWHLRNDANTRSQQVSGCTGWFVPTRQQIQNPGYICRFFWGPSPCLSLTHYWSSTEANATNAWTSNFNVGNNRYNSGYNDKTATNVCARAFRCVTY